MRPARIVALSGVAMATTIIATLLVGVLGAMPTTVLSRDKTWKVTTVAFVPESWSFFTKEPDSTALIALHPTAEGLDQDDRLDPLPQSLAANGFGISRMQRSYDTEKALYAGKIQNWIDCGGMTNSECVSAAKAGEAQVLDSAKGAPNLCGQWLLVQVHVVPYAYREVTPYERKADKAAKVSVRC